MNKANILKIMTYYNLNVVSFANAIGVPPATISNIKNDKAKPTLDLIEKILNTYNDLNIEWLLQGNGNMFKSTQNNQKQTEQENSLLDKLFPDDYKDTDKIGNLNETKVPEIHKNKLINNNIDNIQVAPNNSSKEEKTEKTHPKRKIEKIIIYYSDLTFEEFTPNS